MMKKTNDRSANDLQHSNDMLDRIPNDKSRKNIRQMQKHFRDRDKIPDCHAKISPLDRLKDKRRFRQKLQDPNHDIDDPFKGLIEYEIEKLN